ncbi:MAG: glycosyltransferase [Planctomycetota bacterium]|jgi:trehalose synthase
MLQKVSLGTKSIDKYQTIYDDGYIDELKSLAKDLKGLRLCHINSTPFGGGVAELLLSYIPLVRDLGLTADWQVITGDRRFFDITKSLHNAIQGAQYPLLERTTERIYLSNNLENAKELSTDYDVFIVNDPQPAALRHFCDEKHAKWIWRCHIDSSEPDHYAWQFLRPYVEEYDAAIFTMEKFVPADLHIPVVVIVAPAIDAFSPKNLPLPKDLCRDILDNQGIDRNRPLMVQVSRFDPWKDPFGVIKAYKIAKEKIPGLQLALVGSLAGDDPEGWQMYAAIHDEANKDADIDVFSNLTGVGNMEVNAFQTAANVVIQKSIKEGFGLVVAEALWKETPIVAGNAGGIPMQMPGKLSSYLVNSVEECANKTIHLLENPEVSVDLGADGKENVRRNFLTPRLIRDELALVKQLVG